MDRIRLGGKHLVGIAHDPATSTLEVEFHNGAVYQHADVSEAEFESILSNKSRGSAYARLIRAKYPGVRIT